MIVHQTECQDSHVEPLCAHRNGVHSYDIVFPALENHFLHEPLSTDMPVIFHTRIYAEIECTQALPENKFTVIAISDVFPYLRCYGLGKRQ